jgi:inorganic triphosphatase YgiF
LEIELKLSLPPGQAAAFVRRMARRRCTPERQLLHTRYFDTADFTLSGQGVALRVRRAGRRWVQTLKTEGERQGGLSRRLEYEMPVARGTPDWSRFPAAAQARVPEALRSRLVAVFETRFARTTWLIRGRHGAVIEVALDIGEVRAGERTQPICEVELELKAGSPDALFDLALGWTRQFELLPFDLSKAERGVRLAQGRAAAPVKSVPPALAPGLSVETGFVVLCQACLAHFQANLPGVLGRLPHTEASANAGPGAVPDIEYVHQARVALRRLRALLRMLRRAVVLPDSLQAGLRALVAALGPARDWDVLCDETLPAIGPHYPDPADWQRAMAAMETSRAAVRAAMQAALRAAQPGAWLLECQRWLRRRGWRTADALQRRLQTAPLDDWARQTLRKGRRRIARDARTFAQLAPPQRHALRIAIKRQRYAADFFQPLFERRALSRYLVALAAAQDSLGRANDARVGALLLQASAHHAEPAVAFARGWLAALQADAAAGGGRDREIARVVQDCLAHRLRSRD